MASAGEGMSITDEDIDFMIGSAKFETDDYTQITFKEFVKMCLAN
jgi:hypothetical protein